jgi:hypothetical protein
VTSSGITAEEPQQNPLLANLCRHARFASHWCHPGVVLAAGESRMEQLPLVQGAFEGVLSMCIPNKGTCTIPAIVLSAREPPALGGHLHGIG